MFKNFIRALLFCLLFVKAFSQQSDKISFESGFAFDVAFVNRGASYKRDLFSSQFLKFEYVGKSWAKGNWSVFLPFGLSYMRLTNSYSPFSYMGSSDQLNTSIYHNLNLYFGPQVQHQSKKMRSCVGIFLNTLLNIHTQNKEATLALNGAHYASNNFTGFGAYVSARVFCLFKVGKKVWLGPSCDVFFFDFLYTYNEISQRKNPSYQKQSLFGIDGSSVWINPGFKLQIDLN